MEYLPSLLLRSKIPDSEFSFLNSEFPFHKPRFVYLSAGHILFARVDCYGICIIFHIPWLMCVVNLSFNSDVLQVITESTSLVIRSSANVLDVLVTITLWIAMLVLDSAT